MTQSLCVIGGGAWGTALALAWIRAGHAVSLLVRREETLAQLRLGNHEKLGTIDDLKKIATTNDAYAINHAQMVVLATPSRTLDDVCASYAPYIPAGIPLILTNQMYRLN